MKVLLATCIGVSLAFALHADPVTASDRSRRLPDFLRNVAQDASTEWRKGNYEAAAADFQKIADAAPYSFYGWANLGIVRSQQGRNQEALAALQKALSVWPDDELTLVDLGMVELKLGSFADAIHHLDLAVKEKPDDIFAHGALSAVYAQTGDSRRSASEAAKARELQANRKNPPDSLNDSLVPEGNSLQARYLRAYLKIEKGQGELANDPQDSRMQFTGALQELQAIHASNPEWERVLVTSRIRDLQDLLQPPAKTTSLPD